MVEPTFENNRDPLGGMEIYPGGRVLDLSDDAVRKMEDGLKTPTPIPPRPKSPHNILFGQLDPEDREGLSAFGEFTASTPRPTELILEGKPETSLDREDVRLEQDALQAYYDGRTDLAIQYFSQVKDKNKIFEHLETLCKELADSRDFEDAIKIAKLIADSEKREEKLAYIKARQAKYTPTATGDLEDGDKAALEADFGQGKDKNVDEGRKVDLKIVKGVEEKGTTMSDKELADKFLSYQDADLPPELKAQMIEFNDGSESAKKYTKALRELIDAYGLETIEDLAEGIMGDCMDALTKLGITPSKFTQSKTWAIWDIAKQYHYFTHQDEADPAYLIANPLESTVKQNEIIDRHIGWEIYLQPNKLEIAEVVTDEKSKERLLQYLNKAPKTNGTLSSKDLAEIGEIVSVALNLSNPPESQTEKNIEVNVVPPIPPQGPVSAQEVPPVPNTPEKNESMEANLEALRVARDAYATAYTEWEYKTRHSTKLWEKTMFALGASKPAPERLTLRTTELEEAKEEYLKARVLCGKATSNTYQENYLRGTDEALLLDKAKDNARRERMITDVSVTEMVDKKTAEEKLLARQEKAKNKWISARGKRILLGSTLVAGGTYFAGLGAGAAVLAGGMRVARAGLGILTAEGAGAGLGNYFNRKNEVNAELNLKEYAGQINAENFPEWEAKWLEQQENNENLKRRQGALKKVAMVVAGGATAMGTGGMMNSFTSTIFGHPVGDALHTAGVEFHPTETLPNSSHLDVVENKASVASVSGSEIASSVATENIPNPTDFEAEIYALKVDILSKYHGSIVPDAIQKNILDVPTDELLQRMHLLDTQHNASAGNVGGGHILFENNRVVFEQSGIKSDLYDPNIEVGKKAFASMDFGASKKISADGSESLLGDPVTTADELKITDPALGVEHVSSPEPVMVDESHLQIGADNIISGQEHTGVGETVLEQSFEGDKISVLHGTPSDPDRISMTFGGKEFAVGSLKNGVPKLEVLPQYKGGWFTSTVYERAFDVMKSRIKPELWNTK